MPQTENSNIVVGAKQTLKLLEEGCLLEIMIARDADSYVTRNIEETAKSLLVPIQYVDSMKRLGKQFGVSIGAATAGILKPGIAVKSSEKAKIKP